MFIPITSNSNYQGKRACAQYSPNEISFFLKEE